ncbi:4-carboxy-4-hydroxy-2-oxoadipate aldolase/oxaloacetate decarboxylase [Brevibacterium sp. 2SA]|uniref:4-carboxy-4-hydroxy-2-oxoadipate aldolase/oxaloacetate decarboxylase n=1 Tax=Brevibacterium sp. 2SA TaxID=2502198 RepID=UPI0010F4CDEE|nr:4-carboxy-4-hydroxy-2-oxoadipate aldolase/oxaloacetate decarboxylase [Brevibacterium sp. 2SA]
MEKIIVTDVPRLAPDRLDRLTAFGVATVHEAQGRSGLVEPEIRPIQQGARIAGTAVTVVCWPGDNLMIHAAVEQCQAGDILVVTTNSPNRDGLFGELFATSLQHRGVRGLITTTGVRDTQELRDMDFPAWSAAVSAQGTVKATAGAINVPVVIGGCPVAPGDAIVADDDGVVRVRRDEVDAVLEASAARIAKEEAAREAFQRGELGIDRYGLRPVLQDQGVRYVTWADQTTDH